MERVAWIIALILVATSIAIAAQAIFGGIPADASYGEIFRRLMW